MVVLIEFMLKLHSVSGLAKWSLSLADKQTNKQTISNNDLLEKDGGTKNCIHKRRLVQKWALT